jgi:hypothetical protein
MRKMVNGPIQGKDRERLRDLARQVAACAQLPIMEERRRLWYAHNKGMGERPVIVMEEASFLSDLLPAFQCESQAAREVERNLLVPLANHNLVDDDKVISAEYRVDWFIAEPAYGVSTPRTYATDQEGRQIGFAQSHPITCLETDMSMLRHLPFAVDREGTLAWRAVVEDVLGDLLTVRIDNSSLRWHMAPSQRIVELMGMENMLVSMVEEPEGMRSLYAFMADDMERFLRWQEQEGLLIANNGNDYAGAGSYGFTNELPSEQGKRTGRLTSRDLWGNMNSQETVGISPAMFEEVVYPSYRRLASQFGMVYYGCCEPVHTIWERCIRHLPNLRKVSISAWCDEEQMGEQLRGGQVIYSRKPSPNFIGVGTRLDEEAFRSHILRTLKAARDCTLEIVFRDIYTLSGDQHKAAQAVRLVRELVETHW